VSFSEPLDVAWSHPRYVCPVPRFAVIRRRGPAWDESGPCAARPRGSNTPRFMDALAGDAFVVLGGPLGRGERFLLVIDANDEELLRTRLAADPWTPMRLLVIESVEQ
jgi:hypothetical protein